MWRPCYNSARMALATAGFAHYVAGTRYPRQAIDIQTIIRPSHVSTEPAQARRIASRYVKALFDLALEQKKQDAVADDLKRLAATVAESDTLQRVMNNPTIDSVSKGSAFKSLANKAGVDTLTASFIDTLARQQRIAVLPQIAEQFAEALAEHKGEITAEIITAKKLPDSQIKQLEAALGKTTGKKVHVRLKQDASLIGGVIIKLGSVMLDHSVAGKLERMNVALKNQPMNASNA